NVGDAACAVSEIHSPSTPDGGFEPPQHMPCPEVPEAPSMLPMNMRLSFAGSTAMLVIDIPTNAWAFPTPVPAPATRVSKAPDTVGVAPSALFMRYRPRPKKLSPDRSPSPVPTKTID